MKSDCRVNTDNRNICTFAIYSKTIYDDIIKLGGKERKSLDLKFPNVPKKYLPDFIRGLWDGDGSVFYYKYSKTYFSSYVSASKEFFTDHLHEVLKESQPNLRGCIVKDNSAYVLRFSIGDTVLLKRFMYPEPMEEKLFLKRKYELFQKAEELYEKHKKERAFLNYDSARKIISQKGLKRWEEWEPFYKSKLFPANVPVRPDIVYKYSGWIDWPTWFGNPRKHKRPTKPTIKVI